MAPVIMELARHPEIDSLVCVTAQHRQMLDQVLNLFQIKPDVDLNLMQPNQSLAALTAEIFTNLDPVLSQLKPDWVLIQGDTTTVMAAAILAYYHQIKVGHVEAGLRSGDKWQPFPEEINRTIAGVVADLHFAPTEWAKQNLLRENILSHRIIVTGNPVIDALRYVAAIPPTAEVNQTLLDIGLNPSSNNNPVRLILVTAHRRENFGEPLENICQALKDLAEVYGESVRIVYPVHLNPNVQEPVYRLLGNIPNISLQPPLDYLPFVHIMKRATLILTDSGGLQEEAPGFGIPVLVLRNVTERPEGVQAGTVRLIGTDRAVILNEARRLLDNSQVYQEMAQAVNPYGDGKAAQRIVKALIENS